MSCHTSSHRYIFHSDAPTQCLHATDGLLPCASHLWWKLYTECLSCADQLLGNRPGLSSKFCMYKCLEIFLLDRLHRIFHDVTEHANKTECPRIVSQPCNGFHTCGIFPWDKGGNIDPYCFHFSSCLDRFR